MCGVFAEWNGRRDPFLSDIQFELLRHRGPDFQQAICAEDEALLLFHARLKIIDLNDAANQPMISACGRYSIAFNGEIYNYQQIRCEIGNSWEWRTNSDTEVLLAAWSLWGRACLSKMDGMFAIIIHDREHRTVSLIRDRFGIKPLYYSKSGKNWSAASEIQPLIAGKGSVSPNLATIKTYLATGLYDHTDHTFFDGIFSVSPGTLIDINLVTNVWEDSRWYDLTEGLLDLSKESKSEIQERAEELVTKAIESHLIADVDVGLNVSGGVDSSMLVSHATERRSDLHIFTQDYEGYSELPWVREIAKSCRLHVAELTSSHIWDRIKSTVKSQAEPFGGVFVCGYNYLYELANKHGITVLLDGNGVDEIFLGYKRYHQHYVYSANSDRTTRDRARAYKAFWKEAPRRPALGGAIDGTRGVRPEVISGELKDIALLEEREDLELGDSVKNMAVKDLLQSKIPRGLRFNDRVSMAHSKELRVPFLDHKLVEFALSIPTEMSFSELGSKEVFRNILAKREGSYLAYSTKRSVQSPQREWMANDWRERIETLLASDRFKDRGWIDPGVANCVYDQYLNGAQENSFFLWQWLNLEMWAEEFLD